MSRPERLIEPAAPVEIAHELPCRLRLRSAGFGPSLAEAVLTLPGVRSARLNAAARSLVVEHDGRAETRSAVLRIAGGPPAVLAHAVPRPAPAHFDDEEEPRLWPLVLRLALIATLPALPARLGTAAAWAMIAPRLLTGARSLVTHGITVEVLDALAVGIGAARGGFRTALFTDTLMSGGEYLEETTARRATSLLQALLEPHPETVWVEREGETLRIPFREVVTGDTVVVGAGELVPVDGVVIDGRAQVNEASVTGESLPVIKETGAAMIAGSTVESGRLRIEAQRVGDETTTARIAAFIHESLTTRSEGERLAEENANRRVYTTLGIGLATLILTRDVKRLASVFLIDYACPVKLTTPVAVRATMAKGARAGVLIKGGPCLEKLAQIDTVVFDKTGTLTHGAMVVTDVISLDPDWEARRLLALAASIEEHSSHPVAKAVAAAGTREGTGHLPHGDVGTEVARGLFAEVEGAMVRLGSRRFLEELGVSFAAHGCAVDRLAEAGKMVLFIGHGTRPIGMIGLRDELRADARATIDRLRASGVSRIVMLSGDRRGRAEAMGAALGLDQVLAELQPEDKAEIVTAMKREGRRVVFVGDGINDAPALAAAHVGIAMPLGADIARATADIILMDDRIGLVADAREGATRAMQIIDTNFRIAMAVNTGLFAAASAGWLAPAAASLMHNGSTIALLAHALARAGLPEQERR
ncbi:heavy metal translocating P-type ATPase [Cereibacter sediminicola]|uniref:heavy metal translocating P-type ATPase n=1 Tax=Cereibacter sediminicola TaxID=2584941 RepID=UPI0011A72F28|nr:heavy metal translocating P-type ATPase [Cereibacter sediminicola]